MCVCEVGVGAMVLQRELWVDQTVEGEKPWYGDEYGYTSVTLYELVSRTGNKPHPIPRLNNSIFYTWRTKFTLSQFYFNIQI